MNYQHQIVTMFAVLAFVIGCDKNVPLGGTVTFSDDGSPVTVGTVCFETDTMYARGELDSNGHYVMGFDEQGNGLPPGEYSVCVTGAQVSNGTYESTGTDGKKGDNGPTKYKDLIARKFTSSKTSGIKCTVDASTKNFDFKVDKAPTK